jgi:hypothetical protein
MDFNKYDVERLIDQSLNDEASDFTFNRDTFEARFTFDFHNYVAKIVEESGEIKVEYVKYALELDHRDEDVTKPIKICIQKQIQINSLTLKLAEK